MYPSYYPPRIRFLQTPCCRPGCVGRAARRAPGGRCARRRIRARHCAGSVALESSIQEFNSYMFMMQYSWAMYGQYMRSAFFARLFNRVLLAFLCLAFAQLRAAVESKASAAELAELVHILQRLQVPSACFCFVFVHCICVFLHKLWTRIRKQ